MNVGSLASMVRVKMFLVSPILVFTLRHRGKKVPGVAVAGGKIEVHREWDW